MRSRRLQLLPGLRRNYGNEGFDLVVEEAGKRVDVPIELIFSDAEATISGSPRSLGLPLIQTQLSLEKLE